MAEMDGISWWWLAMAVVGGGLLLVVTLAVVLVRTIRPVELPDEAGFFDTLRSTPLLVAIFLDLLDLFLDGFGAPIAWFVLGRLGLGKLRGVAVIESLIPFTQVIPTMTVCWILGKVLGRDKTRLLERAGAHHARIAQS